MRSLFELAVTVQDGEAIDDPRHIEITVEPAINMDNLAEFGDPDDETLRRAGRSHAATLGRLTTGLLPWVDLARHEHGCGSGGPLGPDESYGERPSWYEACSISGWGLVSPSAEECYQPTLFLIVPVDQRKEWLSRVETTLGAIAREAQ
jgi:hypothetical protein